MTLDTVRNLSSLSYSLAAIDGDLFEMTRRLLSVAPAVAGATKAARQLIRLRDFLRICVASCDDAVEEAARLHKETP
jgi:hypothetical protein